MEKTFTRRVLFGMLAGLVGLAVKPPAPVQVDVDGGFMMYEKLRVEILANVIVNGTGVDYPTGTLKMEG